MNPKSAKDLGAALEYLMEQPEVTKIIIEKHEITIGFGYDGNHSHYGWPCAKINGEVIDCSGWEYGLIAAVQAFQEHGKDVIPVMSEDGSEIKHIMDLGKE